VNKEVVEVASYLEWRLMGTSASEALKAPGSLSRAFQVPFVSCRQVLPRALRLPCQGRALQNTLRSRGHSSATPRAVLLLLLQENLMANLVSLVRPATGWASLRRTPGDLGRKEAEKPGRTRTEINKVLMAFRHFSQ